MTNKELLEKAQREYKDGTNISTLENGIIVSIPVNPHFFISEFDNGGVQCIINGWNTWICYRGQWAKIISKPEPKDSHGIFGTGKLESFDLNKYDFEERTKELKEFNDKHYIPINDMIVDSRLDMESDPRYLELLDEETINFEEKWNNNPYPFKAFSSWRSNKNKIPPVKLSAQRKYFEMLLKEKDEQIASLKKE